MSKPIKEIKQFNKELLKNNTYEQGTINFKGLIVSWRLIDVVNKWGDGENEKFYFKIIHKDKNINFDFYNSIMERNVSRFLEGKKLYNHNFKNEILDVLKCRGRPLYMWGGYDKLRNGREFINKRIYYLLYSAIHSFFSDSFNFSACNPTFKDFCDSFGYEQDSRKAEQIYKECLKQEEKQNFLELDEKFKLYVENEILQETDKYNNDILKSIQG